MMERAYGSKKLPGVIDNAMLVKAIEEQGPSDPLAARIAKREGIDYLDILALRLDYRRILRIDSLWGFKNLTKLQLDNNLIEKIENLDELINLTWLDLSFNYISNIQGLDNLKNLEDLSLFNNQISKIENLDNLVKLEVVSIGNNQISSLDNVSYFWPFKKLGVLNLNGNPVCAEEMYKLHATAFIPSLKYLDYRWIDDETRSAALDKYQIVLEERWENDETDKKKKLEEEAHAEELALHKEAFVFEMNTVHMFERLYFEDEEGNKLMDLPGVSDLIKDFRKEFCKTCEKVFDYGLKHHALRQNELKTFFSDLEKAKDKNRNENRDLTEGFNGVKKKILEEIKAAIADGDESILDKRIDEYQEKIQELWNGLMKIEILLVDYLEETIKEFEQNLEEMVCQFLEKIRTHVSQCHEMENIHHERMMDLAITTYEKFSKNELEEPLNEELKAIFIDKDSVVNVVSASHDTHMLRIDQMEDGIVSGVNTWMSKLFQGIHKDEEIVRNRNRVSEITHLVKILTEELERIQSDI